MSSGRRYSKQEKYEMLIAYKQETYTWEEIAEAYGVSLYSLKEWRYRYKKYGIEGLERASKSKRYSKALKEDSRMVVQAAAQAQKAADYILGVIRNRHSSEETRADDILVTLAKDST